MDRGGTILALDLASLCGWAEGTVESMRAGNKPLSGSHRFAPSGASRGAVLSSATSWLNARLKIPPRPSAIYAEVPAFYNLGKGSSIDVMKMLDRLGGIAEMVAHKYGIAFHETSSSDVRGVFIGKRNLKGDEAKRQVMAKCRALGWEPKDDNAGDALALFAYGCEQLFPGSTTEVLPLFVGGRVLKVA